MDRIALGKRIKALRQNLGITQDKFAEMLNCTNSHIGKIENGKGGISIEMLVSVANILHTTVDQLLLDSYDYKEQVSSCTIFMSVLINSRCKQKCLPAIWS